MEGELQAAEDRLNFINSHKISKYLNCTICQELFKDPMRLGCGYFDLFNPLLVIHFVRPVSIRGLVTLERLTSNVRCVEIK